MARPTATLDPPAAPIERTEKRYVYGGSPGENESDVARRGNRPVKKRKRSPFNIITVVVAASLLSVFYIWNKITVNNLVVEVNDLQSQYSKILSANELIRAEINRKTNLERIGKVAGQMGLVYPSEQPVWFEVNSELIEKFGERP